MATSKKNPYGKVDREADQRYFKSKMHEITAREPMTYDEEAYAVAAVKRLYDNIPRGPRAKLISNATLGEKLGYSEQQIEEFLAHVANTDISDGVPIKCEHDFLMSALIKGANEILWASKQFNNALNMVQPSQGAAVYFGQASEITFLLNYAAKRCIGLVESINEENPNSDINPDLHEDPAFNELKDSVMRGEPADREPVLVSRGYVDGVPFGDPQDEPGTIFGGEKRRKAAEKRVAEKKAARALASPKPNRTEVAALKRGPIPRNAKRQK